MHQVRALNRKSAARATKSAGTTRPRSPVGRRRALAGSDRELAAEVEELTLERERLTAQLAAAEQEYTEARTRLVPIPNGFSEAEHARLVAEALEPQVETADPDGGDLADELTARDLAEVWGTTEQTINRWTREGFPRGIGEPWDNEAWIVEGPRKKRLPVNAIEQSLLTDAQKERLTQVRRRRAPLDTPAPSEASPTAR